MLLKKATQVIPLISMLFTSTGNGSMVPHNSNPNVTLTPNMDAHCATWKHFTLPGAPDTIFKKRATCLCLEMTPEDKIFSEEFINITSALVKNDTSKAAQITSIFKGIHSEFKSKFDKVEAFFKTIQGKNNKPVCLSMQNKTDKFIKYILNQMNLRVPSKLFIGNYIDFLAQHLAVNYKQKLDNFNVFDVSTLFKARFSFIKCVVEKHCGDGVCPKIVDIVPVIHEEVLDFIDAMTTLAEEDEEETASE